MRSASSALTAALIAAALAAPNASAMPDTGPVTDHGKASEQLPGPPTWPVNPKVLHSAAPQSRELSPVDPDDGAPWEIIAAGLAGGALALGGTAALVGVRRRSHHPRVAA